MSLQFWYITIYRFGCHRQSHIFFVQGFTILHNFILVNLKIQFRSTRAEKSNSIRALDICQGGGGRINGLTKEKEKSEPTSCDLYGIRCTAGCRHGFTNRHGREGYETSETAKNHPRCGFGGFLNTRRGWNASSPRYSSPVIERGVRWRGGYSPPCHVVVFL
jgi:hypothetical protein